MTDKKDVALKLALEALTHLQPTALTSFYTIGTRDKAITAIREALAEQPAQQEPDRVKFERHWRKTRGEKKANRELPRHPLQPQTYIQDSANRHWITWQAAVKSVSPPAQRKPLTDEEITEGQRQSWVDKQAFESAAWWAEAKLREKNA